MASKKMKMVALVGLLVSAFSLVTHIRLARRTYMDAISDYRQSFVAVFSSGRRIFDNADLLKANPTYRRLWGAVRPLESLYPDANPGQNYAAPEPQSTGFIFVRIRGGFHEIRNSISDVVAVSRLLNATLVIPEILSTTSSKGISSQFKSFAYLYNEDHFMEALAKDITIVKALPPNLRDARIKKKIPSFRVPFSASPYYYLHHVLPVLTQRSVVELVVYDGGCLQTQLPPDLLEYQKLRCRVAFHALKFREEVQELANKIMKRLRALGQPYIAYDPSMTREALAYYSCAELFQDVHTELIRHKRLWMMKRSLVRGNLSVNSFKQRLKGSCPLMPEEVGILLRAYGYTSDTTIYISGGEIFGGQKKLIPLHAMFENVVDRTSLSTPWEWSEIYGRETSLIDKYSPPPSVDKYAKFEAWENSGPRPRPLPPPPRQPKLYNIEGWWGWVAESDKEPESSVEELRTNAHRLLWEAIDYVICLEADAFIAGFDRDGKGHPNLASLVMGHRLYQFPASRTYRPDRKAIVEHFDAIKDHLYQANHTWISSIRKSLRKSLVDGLVKESNRTKHKSLLAFPIQECSCVGHESSTERSFHSQIYASLGVLQRCPGWMDANAISQSKDESEDDPREDDSISSGLLFQHSNDDHEGDSGDIISNKEEALMEDEDETEGGEK
ncbi:O-fucosyltransferase 27-like isoform X1 [Ipomoea triloba]|uniref:O-fucosyltransferase 27-like isoform X1 n=1 Tax=Ipomoea triloba TaxID=35885 RepID=UPI00125D3880|nr:O-fucosyltransferase 27-like isoform X1 [Ipomoea triloba]XP_031109152.1 O-fucosyltransferase 27-like isoform X1 [Ipomoea triloba]